MGIPWCEHPAWSVVERAEAALGESLSPLLLSATADDLARTREAQLAVFLLSVMTWEALRDSIDRPVAFAGHSLGQITTLVASGSLSLEAGIRLAAQRAECTQKAADGLPGRMAALIGASPTMAAEACAASGGSCWVANDNAPGQIVVGGTAYGVAATEARATELGVRKVIALQVGAAFHTPLMASAAAEFRGPLADTEFSEPSAPIVANTDAAPHSDSLWAERLERHLVSPVRWRESMLTLAGLGATTFLEVGPGAVLSGMARRTVPAVTTLSVARPIDIHDLLEVA